MASIGTGEPCGFFWVMPPMPPAGRGDYSQATVRRETPPTASDQREWTGFKTPLIRSHENDYKHSTHRIP